MTTASDYRASSTPRSDRADAFLDSLDAQDFAKLGTTLTAGARLRALLPSGLREWTGSDVIAEQFARWFGSTQDFELVESTSGEVGNRLHMHWRLRLRAERLGTGWFTVEQQAYAHVADSGRLAQLDLLCTGYLPEGHDA